MKKLIIIILIVLNYTGLAQIKKANEKYLLYEYAEAIPLFKKHLNDKPNDYNALKKLFECYKNTNNINLAINVGDKVIKHPSAVANDWYEQVQMLKNAGEIEKAKPLAKKYKAKLPGEKANYLLKSLDIYEKLIKNETKVILVNKTEKYAQSVFSSVSISNGLLVTAESISGKNSKWTGRGLTKLYITDASFNELTIFSKSLKSKYNDGIASVSSNEDMILYTSLHKKASKTGNIKTQKLKIVIAKKEGDKWVKSDFPFNNYKYNVAHPAINKSRNILVFSSDKAEGKGGMDLYLSIIQSDGTWGEPTNISALNTTENEVFPTINGETLYFSSNGLPGIGGLDLFSSDIIGKAFDKPKNLGAPFNSSFDDFSLSTTNNLETGYVSTNRYGNVQLDDIARFYTGEDQVDIAGFDEVNLEITVQDKYTSIVLPYVAVQVKDDKNNIVAKGLSDPEGKVVIDNLPKGNYTVQGELNGITTTIAKIKKGEFGEKLIKKTVLHNDPRFTLTGKVINSTTGEPVQGVTIYRQNTTLNRTEQTLSGMDGKFFFQLEQKSDFKISGEKKGWLTSESATETTKGLDRTKELYVTLELNMQQPTGNAVIRLDKIFYDFDKCDIKPISAEELDRLIKLMNDFMDMRVELSSHTDSRGSNAYNKRLSQCRADAAVQYIISKGISSSRIVAKGYGESKLVNRCADGVQCTDDEHQQNRRTEFMIISCKSCPAVK